MVQFPVREERISCTCTQAAIHCIHVHAHGHRNLQCWLHGSNTEDVSFLSANSLNLMKPTRLGLSACCACELGVGPRPQAVWGEGENGLVYIHSLSAHASNIFVVRLYIDQ